MSSVINEVLRISLLVFSATVPSAVALFVGIFLVFELVRKIRFSHSAYYISRAAAEVFGYLSMMLTLLRGLDLMINLHEVFGKVGHPIDGQATFVLDTGRFLSVYRLPSYADAIPGGLFVAAIVSTMVFMTIREHKPEDEKTTPDDLSIIKLGKIVYRRGRKITSLKAEVKSLQADKKALEIELLELKSMPEVAAKLAIQPAKQRKSTTGTTTRTVKTTTASTSKVRTGPVATKARKSLEDELEEVKTSEMGMAGVPRR